MVGDVASGEEALEIMEKFVAFHEANLHVFGQFVRFTFDLIRVGREHYGAKAVIERIRWETAIRTRGEPVKINNNFFPYYARLFALRYPDHAGFFLIKKLGP